MSPARCRLGPRTLIALTVSTKAMTWQTYESGLRVRLADFRMQVSTTKFRKWNLKRAFWFHDSGSVHLMEFLEELGLV